MTLYDAYMIVKDNSGLALIIFLIVMKLLDISKIPVNPWKWLIKGIRSLTLGDLPEKVDGISNKLDKHIQEEDERDLRTRRESILDFASALSNGRNYSKEQYEQMLRECDEYTTYCHEKHFINSVADESIKIIKSAYAAHLSDNSFLQGMYYILPKGGI